MARPAKNPFRPGRGVLPPLVAGRDRELALAERRLADLADGSSPSQDFLFYGPRGNGKTTMLLEIGRRARVCGFRVETLPVAALAEHAKLVRVLQERARALESQFTGVQALGFGATATPRAPTEDIEALLIAWIGADLSPPPLVIVLDEVQELSPEVARWFFEAVQRAKSEAPPFLIVAAGTPDAPRRVLQAATSNERGFRRCRVGRLRRPDTIAALREPAREAGRPLAENAAEFLAEESQDYPYFLQMLAAPLGMPPLRAPWSRWSTQNGAPPSAPPTSRSSTKADTGRPRRDASRRSSRRWRAFSRRRADDSPIPG